MRKGNKCRLSRTFYLKNSIIFQVIQISIFIENYLFKLFVYWYTKIQQKVCGGWQIQLKGRGAYELSCLLVRLYRKEMPDLFSMDQIIAIIGSAAVIITAVAKASDSVLAWLKFKKEQKKQSRLNFWQSRQALNLLKNAIRFERTTH